MQQNNMFQLTGVDLVVPIKGIEGAKAYPLGPNCRAPLFDDDKDILYIKTTDANGFPSIKAYKYEEIALIDNNSQSAVSLNDIRALIKEELGLIKEDLLNAQQPVPKYDSTTTYNEPNSSVVKHNGKSNVNYSGNKPRTKQESRADSSIVECGEKQQ